MTAETQREKEVDRQHGESFRLHLVRNYFSAPNLKHLAVARRCPKFIKYKTLITIKSAIC